MEAGDGAAQKFLGLRSLVKAAGGQDEGGEGRDAGSAAAFGLQGVKVQFLNFMFVASSMTSIPQRLTPIQSEKM